MENERGGGGQGPVRVGGVIPIIHTDVYSQVMCMIKSHCNPAIHKRKPLMRIHAKWIDDMTIAEAVNLKKLSN